MSVSEVKDRVAIITGSGKGLGRAFALDWAKRGGRVVVNNRKRDGANPAVDVVSEIKAFGGEAIADTHDIRDDNAPAALVDAAVQAWGRVDALVLNAGVSGPAARFSDTPSEAFRDVLDTNFFANLEIVRAALPQLRTSDAGRLVFVASSAGLYGVRGRSAYAASKGALIGLALSLAHEMRRDGIGVNVLAPYAATQMTADTISADASLAERMAPEKVAPIASWLASPASNANGEIWVAGGGFARRARMTEGGGGHIEADLAWLAHNHERLADMGAPAGFPGAEAAFADFLSKAST